MKHSIQINIWLALALVFLIILLTAGIVSVILLEKSCIPENGEFNIATSCEELTEVDLESLKFDPRDFHYFENTYGGNKEQYNAFMENIDQYTAYKGQISITNLSNYEIGPIWIVLPGDKVEDFKYISTDQTIGKEIYLSCWLAEYVCFFEENQQGKYNSATFDYYFLLKTGDKTEEEIDTLLNDLKFNLQVGICHQTIHYPFDFSRNIDVFWKITE